jgi:hypothetical protein
MHQAKRKSRNAAMFAPFAIKLPRLDDRTMLTEVWVNEATLSVMGGQ